MRTSEWSASLHSISRSKLFSSTLYRRYNVRTRLGLKLVCSLAICRSKRCNVHFRRVQYPSWADRRDDIIRAKSDQALVFDYFAIIARSNRLLKLRSLTSTYKESAGGLDAVIYRHVSREASTTALLTFAPVTLSITSPSLKM